MTDGSGAAAPGGILVVDDEFVIVECFSMIVESMGLEVCGTADTAVSAAREARRLRPSLVLMDLRLKGSGDGVDAAAAIRADVGCPVLFVTGSSDPESMERIGAFAPDGFLTKPVSRRQLSSEIARILDAAGA